MSAPLEDRLAQISALPAHMALAYSMAWGHDIPVTRDALGTIQRYWDGESYSQRPLRRVACQLRGLALCLEQWQAAGEPQALIVALRSLASELLSRAVELVPGLVHAKAYRDACEALGEPPAVASTRHYPALNPDVSPSWMGYPAKIQILARQPGRRFFCVKCGSQRMAERMVQCAECGDLLCEPCAWDSLKLLERERWRCGCGGLAQGVLAWWGLLDLVVVPWHGNPAWQGPPRIRRHQPGGSPP